MSGIGFNFFMTEDEVKASEGNLLSMSDTFILGPFGYMPEEVPCKTGENNCHYFDFLPAHACKGNFTAIDFFENWLQAEDLVLRMAKNIQGPDGC